MFVFVFAAMLIRGFHSDRQQNIKLAIGFECESSHILYKFYLINYLEERLIDIIYIHIRLDMGLVSGFIHNMCDSDLKYYYACILMNNADGKGIFKMIWRTLIQTKS